MVKNLPANPRAARDVGLLFGLGRALGGGNGNPLQCSCLENSMVRGAWWATVHGFSKSWTWLSDFYFPESRGSYQSNALWPMLSVQFSSVQSLSRVRLFATQWITACQASLSITSSWSLLKLMSIGLVMPFSHLILCRPLLLLPPIPPSIRVFSNESTLRMRWPKYWSFSFSISPSNEHPGLVSLRIDW